MEIRQLLNNFHQEVESVTTLVELETIAQRYITEVDHFNTTIISAIQWVVETRAQNTRSKQQARKEAETCGNQYIFLCAQWSPQRVDHYQWAKGSRKFLRQLVKVATAYPRWQDFISNINLALLDRHISSIHENCLPKIGDKHGRAVIQAKSSPVIFRDMEKVLVSQTIHSNASDVDRWVTQYDEVAPAGAKYGHYAIKLDQYGMLVAGPPPLPSKMKRALLEVSTTVPLKTRKLHGRSTLHIQDECAMQSVPAKQFPAGNRLAQEGSLHEGSEATDFDDKTSENDHESSDGDRRSTLQEVGDGVSKEDEGSSAAGAQSGLNDARSKSMPSICCVGSNYDPHHDEPLLEKSCKQARSRHGSPRSGSVCDVNLAWLARMKMADTHSVSHHSYNVNNKADLIILEADHLEQFATANDSAFQVPILVRSGASNLKGMTLSKYLQRLSDRLGSKDLAIVRPSSEGSVQRRATLPSNDIPGLVTDPIFGMNALDLVDFTNVSGPDFLNNDRFQLLDVLVYRLQGMHRTSEIKSCLRFNILGCEGAFSGPHCDILSGTWVQNIDGVKLWMWIHPRDMSEADWKAFAQHKHEWIPPPGKVRATLIHRGETFIMPAGLCIPHAVQTIETCAMVGGMFWDETCVPKSLDCLARLMEYQDTSNEPVPLEIGNMVDELLSFISQKRPELDTSELRQAAGKVKALCCTCKKCNTNCPCAQKSRRCTYLCTNHQPQRKTYCCDDQWWVKSLDHD
jgi:hypothetical protein